MKDIITSILTDTSMRDETAVETALMQQAVAVPWANIDEQ
jgi:hypothetical protein